MKSHLKVLCLLCGLSFAFATLVFAQADEDRPTLQEKKYKEGYVLDLKQLIKKSKSKIEDVEQKLKDQAKLRRNQQREEKAREYYDTAVTLYEEGNYKDARKLFDKAIKITSHPEMKGYVRESVARVKRMDQALEEAESQRLERLELERGYDAGLVDKTYEKAIAYFESGNYLAAKKEFDLVEDMFPDHRATRSYLMVVGYEIKDEQEKRIEKTVNEKAVETRKQKEEWLKEIEREEDVRRRHLELQAEAIYQEAVQLYSQKNYLLAKDRFKEVEWVLPNYKSTIKYLKALEDNVSDVENVLTKEDRQQYLAKEINKQEEVKEEINLEKQQRLLDMRNKEEKRKLKDQAKELYGDAVRLYRDDDYAGAQEKFNTIQRIYPNYRSTQRYLEKISDRMQESEQSSVMVKSEPMSNRVEPSYETKSFHGIDSQEKNLISQMTKERQQSLLEDAEKRYQKALAYYDQRNFLEAKKHFIDVEANYPDYKKTLYYLSRIDDDMNYNHTAWDKGYQQLPEQDMSRAKNTYKISDSVVKKETNQQLKTDTQNDKRMVEREEARQRAEERARLKAETKEKQRIIADAKSTEEERVRAAIQAKAEEQDLAESMVGKTEKSKAEIKAEIKAQAQAQAQAEEQMKIQKISETRLHRDEAKVQSKMQTYSEVQENVKRDDEIVIRELAKKPKKRGWFGGLFGDRNSADEDDMQETSTQIASKDSNNQKEGKAELMNLNSHQVDLNESTVIMENDVLSKSDGMEADEDLIDDLEDGYEEEGSRSIYDSLSDESQQLVKDKYNAAKEWYHGGEFVKAREKFEEVEEMVPGYRIARRYIKRINSKMLELQKDIKKDRIKYAKTGKVEQKYIEKDVKRELKQRIKINEKSAKDRMSLDDSIPEDFMGTPEAIKAQEVYDKTLTRMEIDNKAKEKKFETDYLLDGQVYTIYQEAVDLYKDEKYTLAREKFIAVDYLKPGYRLTEYYLKHTEKKLEKLAEKHRKEIDEQNKMVEQNNEAALNGVKGDVELQEKYAKMDKKAMLKQARKEAEDEAEIQEKINKDLAEHRKVLESQKSFPKKYENQYSQDVKHDVEYERRERIKNIMEEEKRTHQEDVKEKREEEDRLSRMAEIKRKEKMAQEKEEKRIQQAKERWEEKFQEAVNLTDKQEFMLAQEKLKKAAFMLDDEDFEAEYKKQKKDQIAKYQKEIIKKSEELKVQEELARQKELEELEGNMKEKEKWLAEIKKKETMPVELDKKDQSVAEVKDDMQDKKELVEEVQEEIDDIKDVKLKKEQRRAEKLAKKEQKRLAREEKKKQDQMRKEQELLEKQELEQAKKVEKEQKILEEQKKKEEERLAREEEMKKEEIAKKQEQALKDEQKKKEMLDLKNQLAKQQEEEKKALEKLQKERKEQEEKDRLAKIAKQKEQELKEQKMKEEREKQELEQKQYEEQILAKKKELEALKQKEEEMKAVLNKQKEQMQNFSENTPKVVVAPPTVKESVVENAVHPQKINEPVVDHAIFENTMTKVESQKKLLNEQKENLYKVVEERKKQIKIERAKVQEELDATVENLYRQAIATYKADMYDQARRMFLEVDSLKPNYKKVHVYLGKIGVKLAKTSSNKGMINHYTPQEILPEPSDEGSNQGFIMQEKSRLDIISEALDATEQKF